MNTAENLITNLDLNRFFEEDEANYDLLTGVAKTNGGTRIIYLPEDAIHGIYSALLEETGPAWKLIMKNCGLLWGKRVAKNLDKELELLFSTTQGNLPASSFIRMAEGYFSAHGWGQVKFDMSHAPTHGFIRVTMDNSIFVSVLEDENESVDHMIAGMLASLLSPQAKCELDAIEIACVRAGASQCEFIITSSERIEKIESDVEEGKSASEIIKSLAT